MSISIDKFFRILRFYKDNPYDEVKQKLNDEGILYSDRVRLYQRALTFDPVYSLSYPKDIPIVNAALDAREKMRNYFGRVLIPGSYAYNTPDMDLFRTMAIDWSSTSRTFKDTMRKSSDVFSLDDDDVDKAIRGFGIDFVNRRTLDSLIQRALFLLAMTELYKIKGTPYSIVRALSFAYVSKAVIREYWVERDPTAYKDLRIRGVAALKDQQIFNTDTNQYDLVGDPLHYDDVFLTWENFQSRLWDISEPHWWYTNEEIINIDWNPETKIKLPSITPYFGVEFYPDTEKYNILISIIERIMTDQFNSILSGNVDLVPREIGVEGFNEELTERDLWIDGYEEPISLLECFLAFSYAQVRYDEYIQYKDLADFLKEMGVSVPADVYVYPWAYQELVYWGWKNRTDTVDGVITIGDVLKMYPRNKSNYYCSTNELINWWLTRPLDDDEVDAHYFNNSLDHNIPSLFFDTDYNFKYYVEPCDTTLDRILFYKGTRQLDFKQTPFEYFEALGDADRLANTPVIRKEFDNTIYIKSYWASNQHNSYLKTAYSNQYKYLNTYYEYISWVSPTYLDTEQHEASLVTPIYAGKYPKSQQWNWGIDSNYLYTCISPPEWARTSVETTWTQSGSIPYAPDSGPPGEDVIIKIGYKTYHDGYVYKYVSTDKWIRYEVENEWDMCDGPISPTGHITLTSDLAHSKIRAQTSSSIASVYINDRDELSKSEFSVVVDPLGSADTERHDLTSFGKYLSDNGYMIEENGWILEDFSYYFDGSYLYIRIYEHDTNDVKWVRKELQTDWDISSNGTAMFEGEYKYPNLDLTNRYDAERILRGQYVIDLEELEGLPGTTNDGEILLAKGGSGYPETWIYDDGLELWIKNPVNRVNDINLGFNNGLINWVDGRASQESDYGDQATKLLSSLSSYTKLVFRDPDFDIAGIYKSVSNSGLHKNLIDFFKPKRARLLYFSINLEFDDRLFNSVIIDDEGPSYTKLLQEINDYIPRNDAPYIQEERGMWKNAYHKDDATTSLDIPSDAVFYATGFDDPRQNGFYYSRSDLSVGGYPCYLNHHNMLIIKLKNDQEINGYIEQWIMTLRKDNLHWCDAVYVNYSANVDDMGWITPSETPASSSSSVNQRRIIMVGDLTEADVREYDLTTEVDMSKYDEGKENHWNVVHPRPEPSNPVEKETDGESSSSSYVEPENYVQDKDWNSGEDGTQFKTTRMESKSLRHWTPAFCKDPLNIRSVFPEGFGGYPESIEGARISGYDADDRHPGTQEFPHSFWRVPYPYYDDQLMIHDAPTPPTPRSPNDGGTFWVNPEYNAFYYWGMYPSSSSGNSIDVPSWWIRTPEEYFSGPIHHRPIFIGITNIIHDCYPCRDRSDCCDYYDIGCRHDGPTNPRTVVWNSEGVLDPSSSSSSYYGGWLEGKYSEYDLLNLQYDEHTNHHRGWDQYITDPGDQEHWEGEEGFALELTNTGDTFCTPCDDPLFTPDTDFFTVSKEWKRCGIYHNNIYACNFVGESFTSNLFEAGEITLQSDWDFPIGYTHSASGTELVHVHHRPSGFYYWELREPMGSSSSSSSGGPQYQAIYRSELKEKRHDLDDIMDENIGNWHVEPDNFLNGHDIDVVEDGWSDDVPDPSTYIGLTKEEITQNILDRAGFTSSAWIKIIISDYTSSGPSDPYYEQKPGVEGDLNYEVDTATEGWLYICSESDYETQSYLWKRAYAEHEWTEIDEPLIRPDDENNLYGYFYKGGWSYLYINTAQHSGWIRITASQLIYPYNILYTNRWFMSTLAAYRQVSSINSYPDSSVKDYEMTDPDMLYVCGDIVPFNETYEGIRILVNGTRCFCTIEEEVDIQVYTFYQDEDGAYKKIVSECVHGSSSSSGGSCGISETRREHRWVGRDMDPNNYNDEIVHYMLKNYLPDGLCEWIREDGNLYNRELIDNPEDWIDPGAEVPILEVTPASKNYGSLELWEDSDQIFTAKNIGEGIVSGSIILPSDPFRRLSGNLTYNLAAGQSQQLTIRFTPIVVGSFSDNINFSGTGGQVVPLQGQGIAWTGDNRIFEDDENKIDESDYDNRIPE